MSLRQLGALEYGRKLDEGGRERDRESIAPEEEKEALIKFCEGQNKRARENNSGGKQSVAGGLWKVASQSHLESRSPISHSEYGYSWLVGFLVREKLKYRSVGEIETRVFPTANSTSMQGRELVGERGRSLLTTGPFPSYLPLSPPPPSSSSPLPPFFGGTLAFSSRSYISPTCYCHAGRPGKLVGGRLLWHLAQSV